VAWYAFLIIAAILIGWWNRKNMFTREASVTEVIFFPPQAALSWLKIQGLKRFVIPLQIKICYCRRVGMIGQVGAALGIFKKRDCLMKSHLNY